MSARAEFGPLSWDEIEQNRLESLGEPRNGGHNDHAFRGEASTVLESSGSEGIRTGGGGGQLNSLLRQRDRLRQEVRRGEEYLEQIQKASAETRKLIETWPAYEKQCGRNPLSQLMLSLSVNERIERFLPGWIQRQNERLAAIEQELDDFRKQSGSKEKILDGAVV